MFEDLKDWSLEDVRRVQPSAPDPVRLFIFRRARAPRDLLTRFHKGLCSAGNGPQRGSLRGHADVANELHWSETNVFEAFLPNY